MRKKSLILASSIVFILLISISMILSESSNPPLAVDKTIYEAEETVILNITLDSSQYDSYYLIISAANNSYTYKGDFNPVMFFYPTEEGIYTIALVEKSTGAIFYSLNFDILQKQMNITGAGGNAVPEPENDSNIPAPPDAPANEEPDLSLKENIIFLNKNDFLINEKVKVNFDSKVIQESDKFHLYQVYNGSEKRYMGDLGFVEFIPDGIGLHELILTDDQNAVIGTYRFMVIESIAQKFINVVDKAGARENVNILLYDSAGRMIGSNESVNDGNRTYSLDIRPDPAVLQRLRLNNLRILNQSAELSVGIDTVPSERVNLRNRRIMKAFAIDPSNLNFTDGIATNIATGTELWKCKDWVFETQSCLGEWSKVMDLRPGEEYNISLTPDDPGFAEVSLTIINVQSYPTYRGQWIVFFNTTGIADLVIRAVDDTTWSYSGDGGVDLKFLQVRCGATIIDYEWVNDSVLITNFSCAETAYEASQVLTIGIHNLEFRFGDDVKYAHNLVAYESWVQTLDADFNNGTKTNINVSNDSFMLNRTSPSCIGSPSACGGFSANPPCTDTCGCTWTSRFCSNNGACAGLVQAPCSACPGCSWSTSSCPLVEAWNGTGWVAEHEAFPFSIFKSVSRTTYDSLPSLKCLEGEAKIRIYESLPEITYLSDFKAYAVTEEVKSRAEGIARLMKPDMNGRVRFMNKWVLPESCDSTYYSSEECLNLTRNIDKAFAEPVFNSSRIDDWLILSFSNVSSSDVKLYLVVRKQSFLDSYYLYMVHVMGQKQFPIFSQLSDLPGINDITNRWWDDSLFFQVEVWDGMKGEWVRQSSFGAGHQLPQSGGADDFLVSISNPAYEYGKGDARAGPLKVRLRFMTGSYGVDYIAIDDSPDPEFKVKEIIPKSIVFNNQSVGDINRVMTQNDYFILSYDCDAGDEIYTSISGYYNHGSFDPARKKDSISSWYEYILLFTAGKKYVIQSAQEKGLYKGANGLCGFESNEVAAQKRPDGLYLFIAILTISTILSLIILFLLFKQQKALLVCLLILGVIAGIIFVSSSSIRLVLSAGSCSGTLTCDSYNDSQSGCQGCTQCVWNPDTCSGTASSCNVHASQANCQTCGCTWQPYFTNGSLISQARDTGRLYPVFTNLFITNTTPAGTSITWEVRAASTQGGLSSAAWYSNVSSAPKLRWAQWRINLSSNGSATPVVYDVNLTWIFNDTAPTVTNLTAPANGSNLTASLVNFNFTAVDDFGFTNCTLYANFTGVWGPNRTITTVNNYSNNNISVSVPDGRFIWNVLCYDSFDIPQSDFYDYNYSLLVDTLYPLINYGALTKQNNTYNNNRWIYMDSIVTENNEKNITFGLYNISGIPINITTLGPGNRSINFTNLLDGTYYYNVTDCDIVSHCNTTATRKIYLDNVRPVISNWKTNGTTFLINTYICLNVTVTDAFAGVNSVLAEIVDPTMMAENVTLLDNETTSCDGANGNGVYSKAFFLEFSGNYTWQKASATDNAGNIQVNNTNLRWNVTAVGSMNVTMTAPASNLKINESEFNNQYSQTCRVNCVAGGSNCTNVTLLAEYNPAVFQVITTSTVDLINGENSFGCGNLTAGGTACTHTFTITSGSNSGNHTWPIRCSASSTNVGSFISGSVNLTVNDHPNASFIYPLNNSWLSRVEVLNASASFDSDGSINNYLFRYDDNPAFSSPTTICTGTNITCGWNTTQQSQCTNNIRSCFLQLMVTDNDGLTHSTYLTVGFDTIGPVTTLDRPQNFSTVSGSSTLVNASVIDSEIGNISTVTFEYRQNSSAAWTLACADNRGPTYDCSWILTGLPSGVTYELRSYANDTFGNIGGYDVHTNITLDNAAPVIILVSPAHNSIDTDGEVTFVYQVSDLSNITNCSLIVNNIINQTNYSVQRNTDQYFYLSGLSGGLQLNWSVNCTDSNGLRNASERRNLSIQISTNMTINLSISKQSYELGEIVTFVNNVTDRYNNSVGGANVTTSIIFANTSVPWWDFSWKKRKPIILNSSSNLSNVMVEVNITGLDNNITSCNNELRIVRFSPSKQLISVNRTIVGGNDATYCVARFRVNITAGINNAEFYAYYNNSAAANPQNNETRLIYNSSKTPMGGSLITSGAGYNINDGSYSDTASDNGVYYAVGRDNTAFSGNDLGAYINLSFNVSTAGIGEDDFVSFNFTINYCHSSDITAPITCVGVSPGVATNPANADIYNFDSASWTNFATFFQDDGSASERTANLNSSALSAYIQNGTSIIWVEYETDVVLGTGGDTSFAIDYVFLNLYYRERVYSDVGRLGSTQPVINLNSSLTDYAGFWVWNWSTANHTVGNYSAVSLSTKTGYNNDYDYVRFEIKPDSTAPVIKLIGPGNNSYRNGSVIFYYNVSDSTSDVANCVLIINTTIMNTTLNPVEDTTLSFTYSGFGDGQYNWSVNCTDSTGNINTSEMRRLNIDNTGPISTLDRPRNDTTINALTGGYTYTVNASVSDSGVGNISIVTFLYRYNSTDTWKLACRDNDTLAPHQCNWSLSGLDNGQSYEVRAYANDSLGNVGNNDTHVNITIITQPINITFIVADDNTFIPVNQVDLQAGTTKSVYCNVTVKDPAVYTNILGVNATFYSAATGYNAPDNNRTHYSNSSCRFLTGGGPSADYQCIFNVWHFAVNGNWSCRGHAWNSMNIANNTDNTTVNELYALNISSNTIDYANLQPNETSQNVTVNISNVGNMAMNISVYGFGGNNETSGNGLSMLCNINNISLAFERFAINTTADYNSKQVLSSTPQHIGLTIQPKITQNEVKINSTYWQMMVPPEAHSFGQCNGSVVFAAEAP